VAVNVLVVDDAPDILRPIRMGLELTKEFKVNAYTDPRKALSDFQPAKYDLAILDVDMPDESSNSNSDRYCDIESSDINCDEDRDFYFTSAVAI
jgi:DNA-binding response OmpR family regulator